MRRSSGLTETTPSNSAANISTSNIFIVTTPA